MGHISGGATSGIVFGCLVALVVAATVFYSCRRHRRDNVIGYRAGWGMAALEAEQQQKQQAEYARWKEEQEQVKAEKKWEKQMRSAGPSRSTSIAPSIAPSVAAPERAKIADHGRLEMLKESDMV